MKVLVISPQPWDHIKISKHHYARTLAELGHDVLFLEPPVRELTRPAVNEILPNGKLTTLTYSAPFFLSLRFHLPRLYSFLMRRLIRRLLSTLKFSPDITWCFDSSMFPDLSIFDSAGTIYHPVDPISTPISFMPTKSAGLVVCPSSTIVNTILEQTGITAFQINHGLGRFFEIAAKQRLECMTTDGVWGDSKLAAGQINIGYAGNLVHPNLNTDVILKVVSDNPHVRFHFWGSGDDSKLWFAERLRELKNVVLYGKVDEPVLVDGYAGMDAFLLTYLHGGYDKSNSHKVIEYLSTGKVVFSSKLDQYADRPDLLEMCATEDDSDLPTLVSQSLTRLGELNSPERQLARIRFALDNTYHRHVSNVLGMLEERSGNQTKSC